MDVLSAIINHTNNAMTDTPRQGLVPFLFLTVIVLLCLLETGACYITQVGLSLCSFLPQFPQF